MATARTVPTPPTRPPEAIPAAGLVRNAAPIRIPAGAATHAGFRAWATSDEFPRGLKATFLGDEIILDMSPEELETHTAVKGEAYRVLMNLVRELDLGIFYADGAFLTNEAAELSTEPDATFVSKAAFRAGRVRLVPREGVEGQYMEILGTPDWVLEVVSRYSVRKDTKELRTKYHRAGIPEYWLVDARGPEISFQILRRQRDDYVAVALRGGWQRSRVFGRAFRLDRERDDLNFWRYTLAVK